MQSYLSRAHTISNNWCGLFLMKCSEDGQCHHFSSEKPNLKLKDVQELTSALQKSQGCEDKETLKTVCLKETKDRHMIIKYNMVF